MVYSSSSVRMLMLAAGAVSAAVVEPVMSSTP